MEEEWKDVEGYEGEYEVSNKGSVRSWKTSGGKRIEEPHILIGRVNNCGYHTVQLWKNGQAKEFFVHKLVLTHFKSNPKNKPQGNHLDGDKLNNCISNLVWCTNQENVQHAFDNGIRDSLKGEEHGYSKLCNDDVKEMKRMREIEGLKYKAIASKFNVHRCTASRAINGKSWSHLN